MPNDTHGPPPKHDGKHSGSFSTRSNPSFTSVKRYTVFVRIVKYALPLVALGVVTLILSWPMLETEHMDFHIGFASLDIDGSNDPAMVNPRYIGTDNEEQPFTITAEIAKTIKKSDSLFELKMPKADLSIKNGSWLALSANRGVFARIKKELELEGKVNLYHDSGYEFQTDKATIYLDTNIAESNVRVHGQGPFGVVEAQGFRFIEKGKVIFFTGISKIVIFPNAELSEQ